MHNKCMGLYGNLSQTAPQELGKTGKVLSIKFYAEVTKRNRETNGLESRKLVQSAIERYFKEKTLHSCPSCSLGNEIHRRTAPAAPSNSVSRDNETSSLTTGESKVFHHWFRRLESNFELHERGCFRSHFRTACLFVMLEWVFVTWHRFAYL